MGEMSTRKPSGGGQQNREGAAFAMQTRPGDLRLTREGGGRMVLRRNGVAIGNSVWHVEVCRDRSDIPVTTLTINTGGLHASGCSCCTSVQRCACICLWAGNGARSGPDQLRPLHESPYLQRQVDS